MTGVVQRLRALPILLPFAAFAVPRLAADAGGTVARASGRALTAVDPTSAKALVVQPDGRLIAARLGEDTLCLVQYQPDGSLNRTFTGGIVREPSGRALAVVLARCR